MQKFKYAVCFITCVVITGCGGISFNTSPGGTAVKSREPAASLEIPPDLRATTSEELATAQAPRPEDTREVLPEPFLTQLKQDGDERWLEIDASPQEVWQRVVAYWQSIGVGLVVSRPQTGTMETDWIVPQRRPGAIQQFLAGLSKSGYDKYQVRLERNGDKTNLYVDHTWTQKILVEYPIKEPESVWVESEDPEKELELLKAVAFEMDPSNILSDS